MSTTHSLDDLKHYHNEALQFFASELLMLKEVVYNISDAKMRKAATLLMSAGHTGAALLELANHPESFGGETVMLARSFMEKVTNFCYVCICDDKEFLAFTLHPVYKYYHVEGMPTFDEDVLNYVENAAIRKGRQEQLKKIPIVQEALAIFSETKTTLNWTKKKLHERIEAIEKWGKVFDAFFTVSKVEYYSNASEALHGSLYGCTFHTGVFSPSRQERAIQEDEINKKLYKDSTCVLLHLGMLIHESFTLIKYSNDIGELWEHSYKNRHQGLNLLMHVLEKKLPSKSVFDTIKNAPRST